MGNALLEIKNLHTHFFTHEGVVKAVDGVDITIDRGATIGVVGESGCGKTMTAYSILQLVGHPGEIVEGEILYHGIEGEEPVDLARMDPEGEEIRRIRGKEIAMIFQEPMTALSPVYTIGNQICEAILLHSDASKSEARTKAISLLQEVGIPKPEERIDSYTFQLSGGMRQRAMIAMALSCNPKLLIADEPTTAVDVTIQAQILELIRSLQETHGMSVMMITHNLGVISEIADTLIVMYLGKVAERGSLLDVYNNPCHPYTQLLLESIPKPLEIKDRLAVIKGSVPDPFSRPPGCPFEPRCNQVIAGRCSLEQPSLMPAGDSEDHLVSCFLYSEKKREVSVGERDE